MASAAPDGSRAPTAALATSQDVFVPAAPSVMAPTTVEPAVDATAREKRLTDEVVREAMRERGTRDAKMLQESLTPNPYSMTLSYEVVRASVKRVLEDDAPRKGGDARLEASGKKTIPVEKDNSSTGSQEGKKETVAPADSDKKEEDDDSVARDLDMLANTVRCIATHAAGSDFSSAGGKNLESKTTGNAAAEKDASQKASEASLDSETNGVNVVKDDQRTQPATDGRYVGTTSASSSNNSEEELNQAEVDSASCDESSDNHCKIPVNSGAVASPQRQKRAEYSEETRAQCVRRHKEGASYGAIAKELQIPHDTVRAIVRRVKRTGNVFSARRSGRPRKTSGIIDKIILEAVKVGQRCSAKSIQEELLRDFDVKVSAETVRRRVQEHTRKRLQVVSGGNEELPSGAVVRSTNVTLGRSEPGASKSLVPDEDLPTNSASFPPQLQQPATDILQAERLSASRTEATIAETVTASDNVFQVQSMDQSELPGTPSRLQRHKRTEYSLETREKCVMLHAQGQGYRKIGKALQMPHTTVRAIVEKAQRTGSVLPAKRSGRPRKTDAIVDKIILQTVKNNKKSSARVIQEQLMETFGVRVSCETIRRRVKDHSLRHLSASATDSSPSNTNAIPYPDSTTIGPSHPVQPLLPTALTAHNDPSSTLHL